MDLAHSLHTNEGNMDSVEVSHKQADWMLIVYYLGAKKSRSWSGYSARNNAPWLLEAIWKKDSRCPREVSQIKRVIIFLWNSTGTLYDHLMSGFYKCISEKNVPSVVQDDVETKLPDRMSSESRYTNLTASVWGWCSSDRHAHSLNTLDIRRKVIPVWDFILTSSYIHCCSGRVWWLIGAFSLKNKCFHFNMNFATEIKL